MLRGGEAGVAASRPKVADVLVCDPHRLYAEALAGALRAAVGRVLVTTTPHEALTLARCSQPWLCLTALRFPESRHAGLKLVPALRAAAPGTTVVVVSGALTDPVSRAAVEAGAAAVLGKHLSLGAFLGVMTSFVAGARELPSGFGGNQEARAPLSPREEEVLRLLVAGASSNDVAEALEVSSSTARGHVQEVLRKLDVHSRLAAAASPTATRLGVGSP